jgi:hypothetical protein
MTATLIEKQSVYQSAPRPQFIGTAPENFAQLLEAPELAEILINPLNFSSRARCAMFEW